MANPWPHNAVCFEPILDLLPCVSSSPTLARGSTVWVSAYNLRSEPVALHVGHWVNTIEAADVVVPEEKVDDRATSSLTGLVPTHL